MELFGILSFRFDCVTRVEDRMDVCSLAPSSAGFEDGKAHARCSGSGLVDGRTQSSVKLNAPDPNLNLFNAKNPEYFH